MVDPNDRRTDGAPPSHVHIEDNKKTNWLPWVLLALGLLALLFALSQCGDREQAVVAPVETPTATPAAGTGTGGVVGQTSDAAASAPLAGTSALGGFLAGSEAAPRSFTFEKVNFDTAKSEVRAADAEELKTVAGVLTQYPTARVRIAGYADARGSTPENVALGKARAEAVKAALVAQNVPADRIETVSGGESDPVDDNATASGQAENRRTELVVTQR
jgi:outer membrane protein OmpA-like peptidoglycan-associated protein